MNTRHILPAAVLASSLAMLTACEKRIDMEPAAGTRSPQEPVMGDAAVTTVGDVKVIASADAWPGNPDVRDEVTPMKVIIENNGDVPVTVSYEAMSLVSNDGDTFAAIPPFKMEGEIDKRVVAETNTVFTPTLDAERFYVADAYDPVYDYGVWNGASYYQDPIYYDYYYSYWTDREMPTSEMLALALPEGVVEANGKVSGFVYFEELDPSEERVSFQMQLRNAKTGQRFGTVNIPFIVQNLGIAPE